MTPTIRFVVTTALRDKLFISLMGVLVLVFSISVFLGSGAVAEEREMTVVYAAGASRVVIMLALIIFTAFHVERLYETREIEAILSRAISREQFIFSYWLGLCTIACCFIFPVSAATFFLGLSHEGAVYWSLSILFEALIILAFVFFCAVILERAIPTIFVAVGFYGLARLIGAFANMAAHGTQLGVNRVANPIIEGIFYAFPRLDLLGQTRWLVYGADARDVIGIVAVQAAIYVALLLAAAMFDLRHKHF
jgi:ABC-type transport system involved in multi-copper enzyme maturation permease subunit